MSDHYHDRASSGRGPWGEAPELRAKARAEAKQEANSPELEQARAEAEQLRGQLAEVGEVASAAHQEALDSLAYFTEIEEIENPIEVADQLLAASESDPYRLENFLSSWSEQEPFTVEAWRQDRLSRANAAYTEQVKAESAGLLEQQAAERQRIAAEFAQTHPDFAGGFLAEQAAQLPVATNELEGALGELYSGLQSADKAARQSEAVRAVKDSFRDPSISGVRALDGRTGERRPAPPEVTTEEVVARMKPPAELARAAREAQVESFRDAFKQTARSPFAEGMAATRAIGEEARADEWEQRAEALRKARLSE